MIAAVVVILLHHQLAVVHPVHPGGDIFVIRALAGDGVGEHRAMDIHAAKQADGFHNARADPIGNALLVNLKHRGVKHHGGELEAQVPVQVAAKVLRDGVLHALGKPDYVGVLRHHIDDEIGGQALGPVGKPLDKIAVGQRGNADRAPPVVNLGIGAENLELGHHVRQLAQLPVPQQHGGVCIQHGNLIIGDLVHILRKVSRLNRKQLTVTLGPDYNPARKRAHCRHDNHGQRQRKGNCTLLFYKMKVTLRPFALKTRGEHGAAAVYRAQQE
ncbi:hypothetical protein SDC9_95519 [bioreactor metagenome]|uniref:Uncharacterized protein n=1 Tax=bioreactor metagenome TaxID=1076179 RepID=A0A645A6R8_9ZZZZ